jgi:hypothetical protein
MQEQIHKHQIQLQSLQNDVGDSLSVQLSHLKSRVSQKVCSICGLVFFVFLEYSSFK